MGKGFPTVNYDLSKVDNAGILLANTADIDDSENLRGALEYINNWRASHYYPISTIQVSLRAKAKEVDSTALIVQRLKKMQSIKRKLRYNLSLSSSLSCVQDIGGCRVILSTVDNVFTLRKLLEESRWKQKLVRTNDYITRPKRTGYRGIHLIYEYYSKNNPSYDGMSVEIQLRTKLQHIWATAVESVDVFTGSELKSNKGKDEWKRFFALVSSFFAIEENGRTVPGTPKNSADILQELVVLNEQYDFFGTIETINNSVKHIVNNLNYSKKENVFYLLSLKSAEHTVEVIKYDKRSKKEANVEYLRREKNEEKEKQNVVLVSATSIEGLKQAYPNYFMDIEDFYNKLKKVFLKARVSI